MRIPSTYALARSSALLIACEGADVARSGADESGAAGMDPDAVETSDADASDGSGDESGSGDDAGSSDGAGTEACIPPMADYVGNRYDFGGKRSKIDGTVDVVDASAADIAARGREVVEEVEAARATLTYGEIHPDPDAPDELTTYAAPPGIPASAHYAVTVEQGAGAPQPSFVYVAQARKPDTNRSEDTSWTSFSFSGPVTVHVQKKTGTATDCMVRPYSAGIDASFANGVCSFTMTEPRNVSVEFHPAIHVPIAHPMLVFANPIEVDVPDEDDPNVLYLGPGVHTLGRSVPIESDQTIYVAGGAWVEAAFIADGPVQNVTFKGRGVVSGLFMDTGNQAQNKDRPGMIDIAHGGSSNILVEGITFVDAPRFNVRALGTHTTIHNVKTMSWWFSTDGVVAGDASVIEDNFIKVNDDSIKLHWNDNVVRRNVIWQLENGGSFNLSWNIHEDSNTTHAYDNDVIHVEHYEFEKLAVFRSRHAGSGHLHRYLFEDIRVENANWRLFYLVLEKNKWFEPSEGHGEISQVVFRNIHAYTDYRKPNVVRGIDGRHKVRNISFQNVLAGDTCFGSTQSGDFQIDPDSTNAIRIMRSRDGSCRTPVCE